jgi:nucleotide-binding universal stress UspA family protein
MGVTHQGAHSKSSKQEELTMFEKILVPLDTSAMAEQVLPYTIELARAFHSSVDVLSICEAPKGGDIAECQAYLNNEVAELKNNLAGQGNGVKSELITGSPGEKILNYAKNEKVSLTVMSSHGKSGVMLWPIGSTVDKVLRRTGVPLIIVKVKEAQGPNPQTDLFKRILVPLDGSELGSQVVPYIVAIAGKFGSEVILLQVIETAKHVHSLGRIDTVPFIEGELASLKKRAAEFLEQKSLKFTESRAIVSAVVKTGNVAEEIIKYATGNSCGLIAMSSHGHSGFESWIIGSVTSKILNASNKSLLFVPAIES